MKNRSLTFWRVLLTFSIVVVLVEYFYKTGPDPAFISNPTVTLFLVLVFFGLIAVEATMMAVSNLAKSKADQLAEMEAAESSNGLKGFLKRLWGSKPIDQEKDILLDHDYDGIKELDNSLPPWWLYSFYLSMVFAVLYLGYYHLLDGDTQTDEYNKQMEIARIEVAKYKQANPVVLDQSSLSDADKLAAGKKLFVSNCAACHAYDGGGGIGPNLTDDYWILGGGAENIFQTIAEGGRDGKGMIAWKNVLNAEKMQQVTSFVLSLKNTTPEKPKAKEGELWEE